MIPVQGDHQFAEVLTFLPGLDHRGASVDDARLVQFGVAVAADHHVDTWHGAGQAQVVAIGVAPVLPFLQATVAQRDHHIHLLRLAQNLDHLLGRLDGVGKRHCTAAGVEGGLFAEHPEQTEAQTAAFDHQVAADHPVLGQALEVGQAGVAPGETGIRGNHRRSPAGGARHADGLAQSIRAEIEFMVAEGGGVIPHPGHEL